MNNLLSILLLIVGYLSLSVALRDVPYDKIQSAMLGIMFLSWGLSQLKSKSGYSLSGTPIFKKRTGLLHLLLIIPIPLFIFLYKLILS